VSWEKFGDPAPSWDVRIKAPTAGRAGVFVRIMTSDFYYRFKGMSHSPAKSVEQLQN
jgi:hypothetical protein